MVGRTLGHYRVLEKLGQGGMGEVYRAEDLTLKRQVALKVLPSELAATPRQLARFRHEAEALAALNHPCIVTIYSVEEAENVSFLTMELVEGQTLSDRIRRGSLPLEQLFAIAIPLTDALASAHAKGLVHRDLKPSNVMIDGEERVKILDFGLAKLVPTEPSEEVTLAASDALTEEGMVLGTVPYMSPEQLEGKTVDARSDIFSLGVILYEMVTGERPFSGDSAVSLMSSILRDQPRLIEEHREDLPRQLGRIVRHCLEKNPDRRFQSVRDVRNELEDLRSELSAGHSVAEGVAPELHAPKPGIRAALLVAGAIAAILVIAVLWSWREPPTVDREALPGKGQLAAVEPEAVTVLIADFQNDTGDPAFDGALEQAFGLALEGAPFILSHPRPQARKQAAEIDPTAAGRLDQELAQLVSVRYGIPITIVGTIAEDGTGYRLTIRAIDAVTSEVAAEATETAATKAEVLRGADRVAAEIRKRLGDATVTSAPVLAGETFSAASLEAMKAYAQAQELQYEGRYEEAIAEYLRALQHDPDLGRAYAGLAVIHHNEGDRARAEEYFDAAMARIDNMTEREKYRTRGGYYLMTGNYGKAVEELEELVERFPADTAGHANLALAYFYQRDMQAALREGRFAVERNPQNIPQRNNLALYAMYAGDFHTAELEAQRVIELNPDFAKAYFARAMAEAGRDRLDAAREIYERLRAVSARGASLATLGLADLDLFEGRAAQAVSTLEKGVAADLASDYTHDAALKTAVLAGSLLLRGDAQEAVNAADRAVAASSSLSVLVLSARVYLQVGETARALELARELGEHLEPDPRAYALLLEGEAFLLGGDPWSAVNLFLEAQKLVDTWWGRFTLGRGYLEVGAYPEAHSEFENCLERAGEATALFLDDRPSIRLLPPVYYYLGRAQEGLGSPAARSSYESYIELRARGSEDDPLLASARRRLAAL